MTDQEQNSHLSELPLELVVIILKNVLEFDSLFATIQTVGVCMLVSKATLRYHFNPLQHLSTHYST